MESFFSINMTDFDDLIYRLVWQSVAKENQLKKLQIIISML